MKKLLLFILTAFLFLSCDDHELRYSCDSLEFGDVKYEFYENQWEHVLASSDYLIVETKEEIATIYKDKEYFKVIINGYKLSNKKEALYLKYWKEFRILYENRNIKKSVNDYKDMSDEELEKEVDSFIEENSEMKNILSELKVIKTELKEIKMLISIEPESTKDDGFLD